MAAPIAVSPLRHVPALDGIRGIAAALVMVCHLWKGSPGVVPPLDRVVEIGHLGVDMFFALSGFLITTILLGSRGETGYWRDFIVRRAIRILPLYFGLLTLILGTRAIAEVLGRDVGTGAPAWVYYAFVSNLWYTQNGAFTDALLDVSWSLCVEEQFYIVWPAIVLLPRGAVLVVLAALTFTSPLLRGLVFEASQQPGATVATPFRLDGLALGALAAYAWAARSDGSVRLAAVAAPALLAACAALFWVLPVEERANQALSHLLVAATTAALVLALVGGHYPRLGRLLSSSPFLWVGKRSYGLYLLHPIALVAITQPWQQLGLPPTDALLPALAQMFLCMAIAVALAAVSWHYLEAPLLAYKDRLAPNRAPHTARVEPDPSGAPSATGERPS